MEVFLSLIFEIEKIEIVDEWFSELKEVVKMRLF
jgi:hypothetical protein